MLIAHPVFLDLTRTEPGEGGEIVRLAAECVERDAEGREHLRTLERLARPARRLSLAQARVSGLTNQALDEAQELDQTLQDLAEFSQGAGAWIVAEGKATRSLLDRAAARAGFPRGFGPPVVGCDELGVVVLPTVCRRGVTDLMAHYRLTASPSLLRELWNKLEADLIALPLPVLSELNWLLAHSRHPLRELLKQAESRALESQFEQTLSSGKLSISKLFKDHSDLIKQLVPKGEEDTAPEETPPPAPVATGEAAKLLGPEGPLATRLPAYEHRSEQVQMAECVAAALNEGRHLLAEAGTGVGKSMAYLVPAILFARRNNRPVVVSTHTKNLQAQLFHKDLPLLREAMGLDFDAALLKGRPNYLCLRKLMYTLQESAHELDEDERAALLPVMVWATTTGEGDVAELASFSREEHPALWDRLHTVGEDCMGRQCPFYHRCFVYKARAVARNADVVVCNHALLFADLGRDATLPPHREVIFDEAHTLEDVATEHLACEITPRRIYRILNRLFRTKQGESAGKGLLPSLLFQLETARGEIPPERFESIREHALSAIRAVGPANDGADAFFAILREWLDQAQAPAADNTPEGEFVPRERGGFRLRGAQARTADRGQSAARSPRGDEGRRRFSAAMLRADEAERFAEAKTLAVAGLGRLRQTLEILDEDFKEVRKGIPRARELQKELGAQNVFLSELISDLEFVIKADEDNYVYWMERLGRKGLRVVAAPLDLADLLHGQLYEKHRSVVLTSATLSVRDAAADQGDGLAPVIPRMRREPDFGDEEPAKPHKKAFEFLKQRLGLGLCEEGRLAELLEGSPFDYERQARLYLPVYLPSPEHREFNARLSETIARLAVASGGRTLVLYTSYAALNAGAQYLRRALAPESIEVLAQGEDGSREALLAKLKAGGRSILLGTSSFWEGVDVPGEALSQLIIAKLPFQVFTDPIVQGRCEMLEAQGKDPFLHFSVPTAILRLRQGFGRLIRSKSDRGVVVLCDKRVLTKRYGGAFLRALPVQARQMQEAAALAEEVRGFLEAALGS